MPARGARLPNRREAGHRYWLEEKHPGCLHDVVLPIELETVMQQIHHARSIPDEREVLRTPQTGVASSRRRAVATASRAMHARWHKLAWVYGLSA
jgi:hypothetical protein